MEEAPAEASIKLLAPAEAAAPAPPGPPAKICFNCWSSGRQNCKMHAVEEDGDDGGCEAVR